VLFLPGDGKDEPAQREKGQQGSKEDSTFLPDLQRIPFTGFTGQEHTAQPAAGKQRADDLRCSIAEGVFRPKTLEGETFERLL